MSKMIVWVQFQLILHIATQMIGKSSLQNGTILVQKNPNGLQWLIAQKDIMLQIWKLSITMLPIGALWPELMLSKSSAEIFKIGTTSLKYMLGRSELIKIVFGQTGNKFTQNLDKVIFHNELNNFTRYRVISTLYLPGNFNEISKVEKLAKKLGVSVERYDTKKTYFPLTDKIKKDKKHHILEKNNVFHVWW